ncbi:MAG: hypothetical protein WC509_05080 [Candidatus Izemoplasmatales bacterium]
MAKEPEREQTRTTLASDHKNAVGAAFAAEASLYEDFFQRITHRAKTHRAITLNNLTAVEERLDTLKDEAAKLKDSIFFHDEEVVVERSQIIRATETAVHDHNVAILDYDRLNAAKVIDAADDLSRSLLVVKTDFFKTQEREYLQALIGTEDYFEFYMQKSTEFQSVLVRYETEIAKIFQSLDAEIEGMDALIGKIIRDKNAKVASIESFYDREMKHYWDNQYTYSAEPDPTSIEIQAIASDKINQFNAYKEHSLRRDADIKRALEADYAAVYDRVYQHLLRRASYALVDKYDFFDDPERYLDLARRRVAALSAEKKHPGLQAAAHNLKRLEAWTAIRDKARRRADFMLRRQLLEKKRLLLLAEAETARAIGKMARSLDEYLAVIRIDPFLAQTLGDESSKAIKEERLELSMLRVNKELKTNINYDIQSAKIKSQINGLETKLTHAVNRQMLAEESELLQKIADINDFAIESRARIEALRHSVDRERIEVARVERAANVHLSWLVDSLNTDRMWLSLVFDELVKRVREGETHEVYVVEAKAEIELLLKEYEMKAIHFKTAYENELAFLVMQKSRVAEETKIDHDFILTTYQNQMRFAREQVEFAESEYRLRLESLADAVEDERRFHREAIDNVRDRFGREIRLAEDEYQARLYTEAQRLELEQDPKKRKSIQGELNRQRQLRDSKVNMLVRSQSDDEAIAAASRELSRLDDYLEEGAREAERLKDATVAQFTALYEYARVRYEALKPYLDSSVDVLDPAFFDSLQKINDRRHYELKLAEARLDDRIGPLLDRYREVFFKQTAGYDRAQYLELVDAIMASRERSEAVYRTGLEAVEKEYRERLSVVAASETASKAACDGARAELKGRTDAARAQLETRAAALETAYVAEVAQASDTLQKTIARLTAEYQDALRSHTQISRELSDDFARFLQANRKYVKTAMRQVKYRRIVAPLRRANAKKTARIVRDIRKKYRRYAITIE